MTRASPACARDDGGTRRSRISPADGQSVEMTYYAYVLDSQQRLLGVVSFRELISLGATAGSAR